MIFIRHRRERADFCNCCCCVCESRKQNLVCPKLDDFSHLQSDGFLVLRFIYIEEKISSDIDLATVTTTL